MTEYSGADFKDDDIIEIIELTNERRLLEAVKVIRDRYNFQITQCPHILKRILKDNQSLVNRPVDTILTTL